MKNESPREGARRAACTALPLGLLLSITSCSGGGGSLDPNANDLDVVHIEVLTANPQVAHELQFEVTIAALDRAEGVKIDYILMSNEDDVHENEAPEQYRLGTVVYPVVEASESGLPYTASLVIPADIVELNHEEFLLFAQLDPGGEIHEQSELNNRPQEQPPTIVLDDAHKNQPDVVLGRLSFDTHTVLLEDHDAGEDFDRVIDGVRDEENQHLGVTVELEAAGANEVSGTDLTFWVRIPGAGDNPAAIDLGLSPDLWRLEVWDSDQVDVAEGGHGEYESDYVIDRLVPGDTHSVHLDLLIPTGDDDENDPSSSEPDVHSLLRNAVGWTEDPPPPIPGGPSDPQYHFDVRVITDVDGSLEEFESPDASSPDYDDNTLSDELVILPPNPEALSGLDLEDDPISGEPVLMGLEKQLDWKKEWSNERFGVGLKLDSLSRVDGRGAQASAEAAAPVTLFGTKFNLLDLEACAQFVPFDPQDSSFDFDFLFAGLTIYTHTGELPPNGDWSWDSENSWAKSKSVSSHFTVGIVPMEVRASVMADLGYDIHVHLGSSFELDANSMIDAGASAQADASIGILEGGVVGEITLIHDTFKARAFAGVDYDEQADQVLAGLLASATNRLEGPSGRIALYAEWQGIEWCKSFGIPYPCGHQTHHNEKPLAMWEPFVKDDILLDFSKLSDGGNPYAFDVIRD